MTLNRSTGLVGHTCYCNYLQNRDGGRVKMTRAGRGRKLHNRRHRQPDMASFGKLFSFRRRTAG